MCTKNKEYFPEQEIVGWFLSVPGCSMELHEVICQTHLESLREEMIRFCLLWNHWKRGSVLWLQGVEKCRQTGFYVCMRK